METKKSIEESSGKSSNTRLISRYGIAGAFIMAFMALVAGLFVIKEPDIVATCTSVGALFVTITSPFFVLLGHNKRQEVKSGN